MKLTAFWDIKLCRLVEVDGRFRGDYCHHHQGDEWLMIWLHGAISQKAVNFILAALRTWNQTIYVYTV
jgi:hypothetical protein